MKLDFGLHLAYCTNIHRGESWQETLKNLQTHTLAVRDKVCPDKPYAIGLRLSDQASRELSEPKTLKAFRRWLEDENCYVFTINGFPYGKFHGTRVKEQVYVPDWTTEERVAYTNRLFDLMAELALKDAGGSVSTVPGSFKEFIKNQNPEQETAMRRNLWRSVEHIARLSEEKGVDLHLGLEPEPLCYLETSKETADFFDRMREDHPGDDRLDRHLGVNYDTCHLAVEYEEPEDVLNRFRAHGIRISKLHFSSALQVLPNEETREALKLFVDDVYFHQVIAKSDEGKIHRYRDLDDALLTPAPLDPPKEKWRIHFHIPLHSEPTTVFGNTSDHIEGVMDALAGEPDCCKHIEMETYTWEVLPAEMKRVVEEQLADEYQWTLENLARRSIHPV